MQDEVLVLLLRSHHADRLAAADQQAVPGLPGLRGGVDVYPPRQIAAVEQLDPLRGIRGRLGSGGIRRRVGFGDRQNGQSAKQQSDYAKHAEERNSFHSLHRRLQSIGNVFRSSVRYRPIKASQDMPSRRTFKTNRRPELRKRVNRALGRTTREPITALSLPHLHPIIEAAQPVPSPPARGKHMTTEPYDYKLIAEHPKLSAFYSGWIGQKVCVLTHSAVTRDRSDLWLAAAAEVDRLAAVLHTAEKAKMVKLSDEAKTALGELIGHFAAGGWWTSSDGTRERMAYHQEQRELEQVSDDSVEPDEVTFSPRLALEDNASYSVAATVINALDAAVRQAAVAMGDLDACRLGTLLSGFGRRATPRLHVQFVNSILDDLAAHDMTDLDAENEFRRAVGLSEVSEDRRPRSITDPAPVLTPLPPKDSTADRSGRIPFTSCLADMTGHRDVVLACVFRRFSVMLPPAESDASSHPELAGFKKKLRAAPRKVMKSQGKTSSAEQTEFWTNEAIAYLGLDRLDMKRPDMALQRFIENGSLRPTKIGRRNVFKKEDLDRIREKGDKARRRGRPPKGAK